MVAGIQRLLQPLLPWSADDTLQSVVCEYAHVEMCTYTTYACVWPENICISMMRPVRMITACLRMAGANRLRILLPYQSIQQHTTHHQTTRSLWCVRCVLQLKRERIKGSNDNISWFTVVYLPGTSLLPHAIIGSSPSRRNTPM